MPEIRFLLSGAMFLYILVDDYPENRYNQSAYQRTCDQIN